MSRELITIRQWQELYRAGVFERNEYDERAGWDDFYDPMNSKSLRGLAKLVLGVTQPFLLDSYCVCFLEHTLSQGPMVGSAYFDQLSGERGKKSFHVSLDDPREPQKWALTTTRYNGGAPEFCCGNVRGMVNYINALGCELEHDIQPLFLEEKEAVRVYTLLQGEPLGIGIYRDGEHRFHYTSLNDDRQRNVIVAASLENAPPSFRTDRAMSVKGMYIYCPEDAEKAQNIPSKNKKRSKKKEAMR